MIFTTEMIEALEELEPSVRQTFIKIFKALEKSLGEVVKREDFLELKAVVSELAKRVNELTNRVNELAEAQKKTEQRVEELAEAQKKTEQRVDSLAQRVGELAEAQKRTEERLTRVEKAVEELAEAQKRTEEEIRSLARGLKETREMVGGLSDTVGYSLEDRIFPYMNGFALKEYRMKLEVLDRRNIVYPDGRFDEVNIYAEGRRNGEKVYLIGECKARPGKKEIRRFSERLKRIKRHLGESVEAFLVGFYYTPEIERYLREKYPDIKVMKSFEFEMRYSNKR
jgi:chromosome segregation ATPase